MTRGAIGRGLEVGVAKPAVAAPRQHRALTDLEEIGEQRLAIIGIDLSAGRYLQHDVGTVPAVAVLAHAAAAALGLEMLLIAIVDQRVEPVDRQHDHVAALAAIAAAGAAALDDLLAP